MRMQSLPGPILRWAWFEARTFEDDVVANYPVTLHAACKKWWSMQRNHLLKSWATDRRVQSADSTYHEDPMYQLRAHTCWQHLYIWRPYPHFHQCSCMRVCRTQVIGIPIAQCLHALLMCSWIKCCIWLQKWMSRTHIVYTSHTTDAILWEWEPQVMQLELIMLFVFLGDFRKPPKLH